ncbi:MAG: bifunctional adenosylcobinamide kinase/adenosylcobinamide-phosphate guanylyltransferase, partial [Pyrinomonadaceae bacterium]
MSEERNSVGSLILFLGGARAGKSTAAVQLAKAKSPEVCFIATAQGLDEDMKQRIARHRAERPVDWQTIEEPHEIDQALRQARESRVVIVDCLT